MKQNIFKTVFVALAVTLFASCTQNDDVLETIENGSSNEAGYVYTLHLDGAAPVYSDDMTTRAATTWKTGSEVSLRLKSGSSIVDGTAKFDGSNWKFTTDKKLSTTTRATECGALYFENATDLNSLTPSSIVYMGEGTYTASSTDIYVTVTMKPVTGRLRFKGKSGTRISLEGDLYYPKMMSASTDKLIWEIQKKYIVSASAVELKVNSNGYTDYIYVIFNLNYDNWKNTLTIVNETEGKTYERINFDGAMLSGGSSGFLTIPTSNNYASLGWEKIDLNATVEVDNLFPLYDGIVTAWKTGSSAYSFYSGIYETLNEYEVMGDIVKNNTLKNADATKDMIYTGSSHFKNGDNLKSDTEYYMYTVAYNKNGERGPLRRLYFTTRSLEEPRAIISNLRAGTSNAGTDAWLFDVSFKNGAVKYYCDYFEDEESYIKSDAFPVYYVYNKINNGQISTTYNYKSVSCNRTDKQCSLVLIAVDSKENICGYSIAKATTSTKSNVQDVSKQSRSKMMDMHIPKIIKSKRPEIR